MACKNQLLANGPQHFYTEGFVTCHQIESGLVGQTGRDHGLLVQGSDDVAMNRFLWAFRVDNPVPQGAEDAGQAVAGQFVRIANPRPQARIAGDQFLKEVVHRQHGRTAVPARSRVGQGGTFRSPGGHDVIPLQWPLLALVKGQQFAGLVQLGGRYPEFAGMFVEQLTGMGIQPGVSG